MVTSYKTLDLDEYIISLRGTNVTPLEGTVSHNAHTLMPWRRLLRIMEEDWNNCLGCSNWRTGVITRKKCGG